MTTVIATTSAFGEANPGVLSTLETHGVELVLNPYRRKLTESEIIDLLLEHTPAGLIAGLEPLNEAVLSGAHDSLKVISRVGSGWENVDHEKAAELRIKVYRTPDAVTPAVVELTVGLFFDLARQISAHHLELTAGHWNKRMGSLIRGKMLGVIGCGRIGREVARTMSQLGCAVQAFDPEPDLEWHDANDVPLASSLTDLFRSCDLISIHAAVSVEDLPLVTDEHLRAARPNLLLVNVARGGIVDEQQLKEALESGRIAGAALDVFGTEPYEGPLRGVDNIVLTPHIGSYASEAREMMEEMAVTNLLAGLGLASE